MVSEILAKAFRAAHAFVAAGGARSWPRAPPATPPADSLDSLPVFGDLRPEGVRRWLSWHPDYPLLLRTATYGADMCITAAPRPTCPPHRVPAEHVSEVSAQLAAERNRGWLVPLPSHLTALARVVPRAPLQVSVEPTKVRRITDYSNRHPRTGVKRGVNRVVDVADLEPAVMHRPDALAQAVARIPDARLLVRDMSKAFRRLAVRWRDVPWLAFDWDEETLVDLRLPFGHAASAHIVCKLTQAIAATVARQFGSRATALVYVDDFIIVAEPSVTSAVERMFETMMEDLGLPISAPKAARTGGWSTSAEWIGFVHDAEQRTHSLPDSKRMSLMDDVRAAMRGEPRDGLQTLIGRLGHVASVFTPGRAFLQGLREWHRTGRLSEPPQRAMQDLLWWERALPALPQVASMRRAPCASDPVIATDASLYGVGMELVAFRGVRTPRGWRNTPPYAGPVVQRARAALWPHADPADMMTVEAAAALTAVERWAPSLRGRNVWLQLDNHALVHALSKGSSRHPVANALLRELLLTCVTFGVQVFPYHVASEENEGPDILSRWSAQRDTPHWLVERLPHCMWFQRAQVGRGRLPPWRMLPRAC